MQFSLLALYSPLGKLSTQLRQIWKTADLLSSSEAKENIYTSCKETTPQIPGALKEQN